MVDFTKLIELFPSITPREKDSVIYRFLDAFTEEADEFGDTLEDIQETRFIDKATGEDLDKIGRAYGQLGRRIGRDDSSYRKYLKSLVPVFTYRGTVPGIREAIGAGLDIDSGINGSIQDGDVEVYEHYNDNPSIDEVEKYLEYTVELHTWPNHQASIVEELAELSDSSVSKLRQIKYDSGREEILSDDVISINESLKNIEYATLTDSAKITERQKESFVWATENNSISKWNFSQWS